MNYTGAITFLGHDWVLLDNKDKIRLIPRESIQDIEIEKEPSGDGK